MKKSVALIALLTTFWCGFITPAKKSMSQEDIATKKEVVRSLVTKYGYSAQELQDQPLYDLIIKNMLLEDLLGSPSLNTQRAAFKNLTYLKKESYINAAAERKYPDKRQASRGQEDSSPFDTRSRTTQEYTPGKAFDY